MRDVAITSSFHFSISFRRNLVRTIGYLAFGFRIVVGANGSQSLRRSIYSPAITSRSALSARCETTFYFAQTTRSEYYASYNVNLVPILESPFWPIAIAGNASQSQSPFHGASACTRIARTPRGFQHRFYLGAKPGERDRK